MTYIHVKDLFKEINRGTNKNKSLFKEDLRNMLLIRSLIKKY